MTTPFLETGLPEDTAEVLRLRWEDDRLRWRIARRWSSMYRLHDVQRARALFEDLQRPTRVTRPLFGATMHLDLERSSAQQLIYLMGERFIGEYKLIRELVKPGTRIVDVGANIGYHLLMFEQLIGASGQVICIEPSPENLPELKANIEENGFTNVELHEVAVGAESGQVGVRGGINSGIVRGGGAIAQVPLKTLSELVNGPIDLVKIDVDGYEGEVLAGALELLDRYKPTLLLEVHPHVVARFGTTTSQVIEQVRSVYPAMKGFDQYRPEASSSWRRLYHRYVSPFRLRSIENLDRVMEDSDQGEHNWTFWVVAATSENLLPRG